MGFVVLLWFASCMHRVNSMLPYCVDCCVACSVATCVQVPLFVMCVQPHGLSCRDNVVKECWEEAGVPEHLAAQARPTGFVSYVSFTDEGLKPDVLFCYDLELPADFMPQPQDGEVI